MTPGYNITPISQGLEEFAAAREQFAVLVGELQARQTLGMEHGEVEALIAQQGTELLRRLLQGHLDLRAVREPRGEAIVGEDSAVRRHVRPACQRTLMSLFGEVAVTRLGYGARGVDSVFPLDRELNLPPDKYSHGLRRRIAEAVAQGSFDEAVASVVRTTGGKVPKRQAETLVADISQDFEAFYQSRGATELEPTSDPLVLSEDGKGIVMRREDLREATRRAAERGAHKLKTRLSRGEKRNRKRMATVATVYSIAPQVRSAEAIMGLEDSEPATPRPRARHKRVWASVARALSEVTEALFEEALRRDPHQQRPWVMLVDGHEDQLASIQVCSERHQVEVTLVLDFIHVLEYLWKAAYCFHAPGTEAAESWVGERALAILKGSSSEVAGGMRRSATLRGLAAEDRQAVDDCADYLLKYRNLLRYDAYLAAGFPIATGVIEGACRHLVKDRMDITGARWRLRSAEAVLKLRSLHSSGDEDSYWEFHKAQALKRNHPLPIDDHRLPKAA
jgi:hypothetical protein